MKLERPLYFFDLETTGTNVGVDRIVEIAVVGWRTDGTTAEARWLVNPEMPIPPESTAIHGITNDIVRDEPNFRMLAPVLALSFEGADLAGFNVLKFDLPFLEAEFERVGMPFDTSKCHVVDVMKLFHKHEPRDLAAAMRFYCNKDLDGAHRALNDIRATAEVLKAQMERYHLEGDVVALAAQCIDADAVDRDGKFKRVGDEVVFTFGKYKGSSLAKVAKSDPNFLGWMLKADFSKATKRVAWEALSAAGFAKLAMGAA